MIDPVQSIRIAANLAERFKVLVKPGGMGIGTTVAELELRIGEAQQIYPEIWRHLEDAHKVLVERGADVAQFRELRGGELVLLGVTEVESETQLDYLGLMVGRLRYAQVKTATFNAAGYARALAACKALMAAMPDVDWAALAKAEEQEIRAAGSLQAGKYLGIVKALAIAGVVSGVCFGIYKLATHGGDPDVIKAEAEATAKVEESTALREKVRARKVATYAAREKFEQTCALEDRIVLARLYREASEETQAKLVEAETCRPRPPGCSDARDDAQQRIIQQFDIVENAGDGGDDWLWRCAGGFFEPGWKHGGLAVALTGKTKAGKKITVRGIVEWDGKTNITPFEVWPHQISSNDVGDLDGDGIGEVVSVHPQGVTVSRVKDGKLVDVASLPIQAEEPLAKTCTGSVALAPDPEKDHGERLVVNVDEEAQGKGCPTSGYHAYILQGDKLVDAAPPD